MIKYLAISNYYFDKDVIKEASCIAMGLWYDTRHDYFKNNLYEAFNEFMSYSIGTQKNVYIIEIDTTNIIYNNKFTNSDIIHIYKYEDFEHLKALI